MANHHTLTIHDSLFTISFGADAEHQALDVDHTTALPGRKGDGGDVADVPHRSAQLRAAVAAGRNVRGGRRQLADERVDAVRVVALTQASHERLPEQAQRDDG